jgi:hypothetical protein
MPLVAPWVESKYKRAPLGSPTGGQFVTKGFKAAADNQKASKAVVALANQAISGAQLAPVRQYLADSGPINRVLRGLDTMDPRAKALIAKVDAALAQSRMPQSVVAFREMTPTMAQALAELEPGDLIEDQGYVSASLSPLRPHNVASHHGEDWDKPPTATAYKLLIPKGSVALPLPGADNEILIARGSRYRFMGFGDDRVPSFQLEQRGSVPAEPVTARAAEQKAAVEAEARAEAIKADLAKDKVGATFVSPNTGSLQFSNAEWALKSSRHQAVSRAMAAVDRAMGLDAETHNVVGAWADGAENSTMSVVKGVDYETLRVAAAMKGHLADQKQVLLFLEGEGDGHLASFSAGGNLADIHAKLLSSGLEFHTLEPVAGGAMVHLYGEDQGTLDKAGVAAESYGSQLRVRNGQGEFIGTQKQDGTDAEQRADARRAYRDIIGAAEERGVGGARRVWRRLYNRYGLRLDGYPNQAGPAEIGGHAWGAMERPQHPGEGYSANAELRDGVIHTTDVRDAARALFEDRKVSLDQPRKVSTLLTHLGQVTKNMEAMGQKAPVFNLCNVTVQNSSLFCVESKGIPRVQMPQLSDEQMTGFVSHLRDKGYAVKDTNEYASYLRATQNELNGQKVAKGIARLRANPDQPLRRIMVSRDNYILDGHHSWGAKIGLDAADGHLTNDLKMPISRVDISITDLLQEADRFTGGKGRKAMGDRG